MRGFFFQRDRGQAKRQPQEDTDPIADLHPIYRPLNPAKDGAIRFIPLRGTGGQLSGAVNLVAQQGVTDPDEVQVWTVEILARLQCINQDGLDERGKQVRRRGKYMVKLKGDLSARNQ
jgi:hypothetical protein